MDMSTLLFIGLAVVIVLLIVGLVNRLIHMVVSTVVIVVVICLVWNIVPIEYRVCADLSLALSGSKIFEKISPEHEKIIQEVDVVVNFDSSMTVAYPKFATTSSRKEPITNDNNHEFDINLFSFDRELQSIRVVSTPKNAETVTRVLSGLGIKIVK